MSAKDVVSMALSQVNYQEKASARDLEVFSANPGTANYTKYGAWYGLNPAEWCDMFVSWCAARAGEGQAVGRFAYCPSHVQFFKNQGRWYPRGTVTPRAGDIIFFGDADHVGIVEACDGSYVHTVEGNTRSGSSLVTNGGGVYRKSYPLGSSYIMGYGRPAYGADAQRELEVYHPWKSCKNGGSDAAVYRDTDLNLRAGSLNPGEQCWCLGRYGDAALVCYRLDGTADDWAVGYTAKSVLQ